jgi:hypothetical protein
LVDEGSTGQFRSFRIEVNSLGGENALAFSLSFDPARMTFVSVEKGVELEAATLNVNVVDILEGRIGVALALPAGSSLTAGQHRFITLTFKTSADAGDTMSLNFSDRPIRRETVDVYGNPMRTIYVDSLAWRNDHLDWKSWFAASLLPFRALRAQSAMNSFDFSFGAMSLESLRTRSLLAGGTSLVPPGNSHSHHPLLFLVPTPN